MVACHLQLQSIGPGGGLRPLEEVSPVAAMRFECIKFSEPEPSAENLLTALECYFSVPSVPAPGKPDTYVFGEIAEATFGGKGREPVGMFTVLHYPQTS